jgi:MoaA/NifB/PqqE/SkfB family radical SAM enzyme
LDDNLKYYYRKLTSLKSPFIRYPESKSPYIAIDKDTMIEFNKYRFHGPKKLACYNPFVNLYFNSRGSAVVCCRNQETVLGTYPEKSIKEIWFGETAKKLRQHLLNNDLSMGCSYCNHQFKTNRFSGLPSMHADRYSSTKRKYPAILELELSNKCNLECIMCSGIVSSSIRKNRECTEELKIVYDSEFVKQLEEFLPHAKEICFYGGEPFLIDSYYQIWDILLKNKSNAKLHAVTNGTVFNPKIEELLKNLNFSISISYDATEKELFERIRKGANFEKVSANIEKINQILGRKGLCLSMTPMKSNCFEVPKVIDYCNSLNATINLSFVERPADMAIWSEESDKLAEIEEYYKSYVFKKSNRYNSKYNNLVYNQFIGQISIYQKKNKQIENDFLSKYPNVDKSKEIITNWFYDAKQKKILSKIEIERIKSIIDSVTKRKNRFIQVSFYANLSEMLVNTGEDTIKKIRMPNLDYNMIEEKLISLVSDSNIYGDSYL